MEQVLYNILFPPDIMPTSGDFFKSKRDDNIDLSRILPVLICWSCQKAPPTGGGAYTTEVHFLMILEARSSRSKCWQGWFFSEASALGS